MRKDLPGQLNSPILDATFIRIKSKFPPALSAGLNSSESDHALPAESWWSFSTACPSAIPHMGGQGQHARGAVRPFGYRPEKPPAGMEAPRFCQGSNSPNLSDTKWRPNQNAQDSQLEGFLALLLSSARTSTARW